MLCWLCVLIHLNDAALSAQDLDSVMFADPPVEVPAMKRDFPPQLKTLWLQALAGPEADLRRQAAETIVRAHRRGMPQLEETADPLIRVLDAEDEHPQVRLAAAAALVEIRATQAAPRLLQHALQDGLDMALLVEPALAQWDFRPARPIWLGRLSQPQATDHQRLLLALDALGLVREPKAERLLRNLIAQQHLGPSTRLAVASALGQVRRDGLEQLAGALAGDKSQAAMPNRLSAAVLLQHHSGVAATNVLLELAVDPQPAVCTLALQRLLELDPSRVLPIIDRTIANPDPKLRYLGAQALAAAPSQESVVKLISLLDDTYPKLRQFARQSLLGHARDASLDQPVRQQAGHVLDKASWRGQQQAILLLVALDHKACADRLLQLLHHRRAEVSLSAAWALRKLAVPDKLPAMLDYVERLGNWYENTQDEVLLSQRDRQIAQLFQAFGQMKYQAAEVLMRQSIPKDTRRNDSRSAAIWALGHLHADQPDPELIQQLVERLSDTGVIPPELPDVRRMAAVSLGRMKAASALDQLRRFHQREASDAAVAYACAWAVGQITGQPFQPPEARIGHHGGWFLEPLDITQ